MRYSTVQYVVVGEEQRPDRRYYATASMYRIVCKMGIANIQGQHGTVLVHICPPEDGISTFFLLFFPFSSLVFCLLRPFPHHTGTQDLCSLVYNSSMKKLDAHHGPPPDLNIYYSPPYLFYEPLENHSPRTPIFRFSGLLAYALPSPPPPPPARARDRKIPWPKKQKNNNSFALSA